MHLLDFVNEIWDIAEYYNTDTNLALTMFLANIRNMEVDLTPIYKGADVDYSALMKHYKTLTDRETFLEYQRKEKMFHGEIAQLRKDGKRDAVSYLFTDKDEYIPKVTEQTKI